MNSRRAYIETHPNGLAIDRNVQAAIDGFLALAYEITTFTREDIEADKFWRVADKHPFVGSIKTMTQHFANLGKVPERLDYPQPLQGYLGRSVKEMPLEEALLYPSRPLRSLLLLFGRLLKKSRLERR